MKKLTLNEWAAIGELIASVSVVISLFFLIQGINRNTEQAKADSNTALFREVSQIELAIAADERWTEIIIKGSKPNAELNEIEQVRFDAYIEAVFDAWDGISARATYGLVLDDALASWDDYFVEWTRRHVSRETWERLRWAYDTPDSYVAPRVRYALGIE